MKQILVFWSVVGAISFFGFIVTQTHESYVERKQDKEFIFEIQLLNESNEEMKIRSRHPPYYDVVFEGGGGGGVKWHGFYEKDGSFVYVQILNSDVFILRRNPYARLIINVKVNDNIGGAILDVSDHPKVDSFSLCEVLINDHGKGKYRK